MANILLIDDSPSVVQALGYYLETLGYAVIPAHDGRSGLKLAAERRPDLILLDLEMPLLSGVAVCRALKADPALSQLPVVMMTGQATQEVRKQGLAAGAVVVLSKPFDLELMRTTVARQIPGTEEA